MPANARGIVADVLPPRMTKAIWSVSYDKALPLAIQNFELSAVLPAVFYMFRFGQRRGKGGFLDAFAPNEGTLRQRRRAATVERIADRLAARSDFSGFEGEGGGEGDDEVEKAILGDLLLCFSLENVGRSLGRDRQVQRIAPCHYMASWVDLPEFVAHLRRVPEMIVAMLADQKGDFVVPDRPGARTRFAVGSGHDDNLLLQAFNQGMSRRGPVADQAGDCFDEKDGTVGLDQLLTIRLAQQIGSAPPKMPRRDHARISNQRPIAEKERRGTSPTTSAASSVRTPGPCRAMRSSICSRPASLPG